MFVGRDRELMKLETLYERGEFEFVVFKGQKVCLLYGCRRNKG